MQTLKRFWGVALMAIGALLLLVCQLAGWQSNTELLIGLILIIFGFIGHVRSQETGEKY